MIETIIKICKVLDKNKIDYFISGGSSLFLRNLITSTKDIDITVFFKDLKKIKFLFLGNKIILEEKYRLVFDIDGCEIEFMGVPKAKDPISFEVLKNKSKMVDVLIVNDRKLNLIKIEQLLKLYKLVYNRDGCKIQKHKKRIEFLEKIINE